MSLIQSGSFPMARISYYAARISDVSNVAVSCLATFCRAGRVRQVGSNGDRGGESDDAVDGDRARDLPQKPNSLAKTTHVRLCGIPDQAVVLKAIY